MIFSKFGTKLMLVSKTERNGGQVSVQTTTDGTTDVHDYNVFDLKADEGMNEIDAAVDKVPWRAVETKVQRRNKKLR